ncbi:MAG: TetR family transcriptional regulator [Acidimicrobiia bacterium]|nr:MAG: TetR family transcriptional regulator [Acidimicrobiia bacterium]
MNRRDEIVAAAVGILEAAGPEALTMRRLGHAVGMRAPSLYKHFASKDELLAALQEHALADLGAALERSGGTVCGLARAYRTWALAHPALYDLAMRHPLARHRLAPGVEEAAAAPVVSAAGGDVDRARAMWGAAHGLVDLELAGRFPPGADIDAAWAETIRLFSMGTAQ